MSALPPMLPYLTVSDGAAAIAFYKKAFRAVEHEVHRAPESTKKGHFILKVCYHRVKEAASIVIRLSTAKR